MSTITTTEPVIRLEVSIPLDIPVLVQRRSGDADLLATVAEWRFVTTADPDDYRFGGYETVTVFDADSDNFTYYSDAPPPEWVPAPHMWDALKVAAQNATGL